MSLCAPPPSISGPKHVQKLSTTIMTSTLGFLASAGVMVWFIRRRRERLKETHEVQINGVRPSRRQSSSSSNDPRVLRLGTRKSDLAMVQTRYAAKLIQAEFPQVKVEIIEPISAYGDKQLDQSLKTLATKTPGLFTKDLEEGLVNGAYDVAVHSLKDVPTTLPEGLVIAGITEREDPRDALVVREEYRGKGGLAALPNGAVIGTSSVRREALLLRDYKHLEIKLIRGNVNTRLRKLDHGEYDAVVLAVAGLKRLGPSFEARIEQILSPPDFYYGVGQGALGLQCRASDESTIAILKGIEHGETAARCRAERALLRTLEGGCQVPLGVTSRVDGLELTLTTAILAENGQTSVQAGITGGVDEAEVVGVRLAKKVLSSGGRRVLAMMKDYSAEDVSKRPLTYGSAENPNFSARNSK